MNIITFIPLTNYMLGRLVTLMIAEELARQDATRTGEAMPVSDQGRDMTTERHRDG